MIANLFFWNKTIYQKVAGYLRGLAQLKVCSFSRLSTDSFSCMTSFPSPEYKPSYNSEYVHLTTLFLLVPCFTISLTICLEHIFIENVMYLYLFNESLGLFSSRGCCPR
jgi:hypothetical protein